ncbi:MAG: tetratricopeptide repeat protein [Solirubrobacterales bacterium]
MRGIVVFATLLGVTSSLTASTSHPLLGESNDVACSPSDGGIPKSSAHLQDIILGIARAASAADGLSQLTVYYPLEGAVFPPDMAPPAFVWSDTAAQADTWHIDVAGASGEHLFVMTQGATPPRQPDDDPRTLSQVAAAYRPAAPPNPIRRWRPSAQIWEKIKDLSGGRVVTATIIGFGSGSPGKCLSRGRATLSVSQDPVAAPIFYRDVPLPFRHVLSNIDAIRWRLGNVSSLKPPTVLTGMKVCGNCHSFTADGRTLAMDVDYGSDKGSYIIAEVQPQTVFARDNVISWSDYRRQDKEATFGLLAQISPDGRYVVSTVKDRSVFAAVDELDYSQRFFPVAGIVAVYDRQRKEFFSLKGADDRRYVQSNPVWSPDGKTILFARAESYTLTGIKDPSSAVVEKNEVAEFFEGGKKFRYDLWRVDFNDGRGGVPIPVTGASGNGRSNYFPRFSPDGKWIVFCQSDTFMLLRPDSLLYIMPAAGGTPRRMRCNFQDKMNSWHSWSPNGRWIVFSSKADGPFTQLWLTHVNSEGNDSPAVLLEHFTAADRAANIPEFVNLDPERFREIRQEFADYYTFFRIGVGHEQRHQYALAIEEFRKGLAAEPNHVESLYLLASCLARLDREEEALPHARKAARLAPTSPAVQGLLGSLLSDTGRYGEALSLLETARTASPNDVGIANNLAWVLATCPESQYRDGVRSLELAKWACKATDYRSPPLLDSLAAAYAELGQFDQAISTTQQAIEIVLANPKASVETLESRLKLYRAGLPYRESTSK